mmetsp:Transcript_72075/g.234237  ORF Transcript_72075/g.234237 Transcript_72075/m.234237 type:complete len:218 (+) Transcript_72075:712-1365(+)
MPAKGTTRETRSSGVPSACVTGMLLVAQHFAGVLLPLRLGLIEMETDMLLMLLVRLRCRRCSPATSAHCVLRGCLTEVQRQFELLLVRVPQRHCRRSMGAGASVGNNSNTAKSPDGTVPDGDVGHAKLLASQELEDLLAEFDIIKSDSERRVASDGITYTKKDFETKFGSAGWESTKDQHSHLKSEWLDFGLPVQIGKLTQSEPSAITSWLVALCST